MLSYVLIHGAWHGGWCWAKLEPFFLKDKSNVIIPTLPFTNDSVGLETHVGAVIDSIESTEHENLVLIGHSYAGMLLARVADRFKNNIRGIIFLDAVVPEKGQCFYNQFYANNENYYELMHQDIALQKLIDPPHPNEFGVASTQDVKMMLDNLRPHPLKTFCDPATHSIYSQKNWPKMYIACSKNNVDVFMNLKKSLVSNEGWHVQEIDESHDVMITNPERLYMLIKDFSSDLIP